MDARLRNRSKSIRQLLLRQPGGNPKPRERRFSGDWTCHHYSSKAVSIRGKLYYGDRHDDEIGNGHDRTIQTPPAEERKWQRWCSAAGERFLGVASEPTRRTPVQWLRQDADGGE